MNEQELGVFLAKLSTGSWLCETVDLAGALSPWQILMERCRRTGEYVTDLRLRAGSLLLETQPHAPAYFSAIRLFKGLGADGREQELAYKGVGWVTADRQRIEIVWGSARLLAKCCLSGPHGLVPGCGFSARLDQPIESRPCERCHGGRIHTAPDAWRETRPVRGVMNLIWSNPAEGGHERDVVIHDGQLWVPGPGDAAIRAEVRR